MRYRIRKSALSNSYCIEMQKHWWSKWLPTNHTWYGTKESAKVRLKEMCANPEDITYYDRYGNEELCW